MGDDITQYQKKFWDGKYILEHKNNGDCIYLDRQKGCTIYDRRPYICVKLDCRVWLIVPDEFKSFISKKMIKAARRIKKKIGPIRVS